MARFTDKQLAVVAAKVIKKDAARITEHLRSLKPGLIEALKDGLEADEDNYIVTKEQLEGLADDELTNLIEESGGIYG